MSVSRMKNTRIYSEIFMAISLVLYTKHSIAEDVFDINAINTGIESQVADVNSLGYLSYEGGQLPGIYFVDIYINENLVDNKNITFFLMRKLKN